MLRKADKYGLFDRNNNYIPYPDQYDSIEQKYYFIKDINSSTPALEMPYLVFKKDNKYGVDNFNIKLFTMVPFEYDDIIERNIIVKNQLFGVWDDTPLRKIHIPAKYLAKPELFKEIQILDAQRAYIYKCLNKNNKIVYVYRNGIEFYRK